MRHSLPSFREPTPPVISEYWGSGMFVFSGQCPGRRAIHPMHEKPPIFIF